MAVRDNLPPIEEALVPVVAAFERFFNTLGPLLPDINSLAENLQKILPGQTILSQLAEKVFPILEPYLDTFLELIGNLGKNILPTFSGALEAVESDSRCRIGVVRGNRAVHRRGCGIAERSN